MKNQKFLAWGLLVILSLIWGSSFILIKKGLVVYSPGELGAMRILAACLFLVPLSIPKLRTLSFRQIKLLFIIGMVGSFIPAFLFAIAQTQLDSGITGVLNALTPLSVLIMGALFFSQKITKSKALGIVLGFMGTAILLLAGSGGDIRNLNFYALFVVLATICYGTNLNVIKFYLAEVNAVVITSVSLLFMGPLAGVYLLTATDFTMTVATKPGAFEALGYIVLLGIMGTAIALILFNYLVKITNPIFSSSVTYLIPIVALGWGVLDGEIILPLQIVGIAAIFAGVFITNRRR